MQSLRFELITPERVVLKEEFDAATVPTREGEITVLPGHVPLVASLAPGMITVSRGGNESYLAVSGGFIEVQPDSRVVILADTAERAEELDLDKVEAARQRAETLISEKRHVDDFSSAAAVAALERELARLRVAKKHRSGRRQPPLQR
ncbi:MAG TPA: F0F1 ATP synthase subunit epsilon [Candidatus Eisenbacteria bacterium]|jgi:F-type H+-transporting ATPase subunit epsilon|nr:F0F1 ATP synthase subunit epsilon [Candidatus Eisenbacteria bacterium]